jgi:hypothetical protein
VQTALLFGSQFHKESKLFALSSVKWVGLGGADCAPWAIGRPQWNSEDFRDRLRLTVREMVSPSFHIKPWR